MPQQHTKNNTKSADYTDECFELALHNLGGRGILKPRAHETEVREFMGLDSYAPPLGKKDRITLFNCNNTLTLNYEVFLDETPRIEIRFKPERTSAEYAKQSIYLAQEPIKYGIRAFLLCSCGKKCNKLYLSRARISFSCRYCLGLKYKKKPRRAQSYELEHLIDSHLQAPELRTTVGRLSYGGVMTKNARRALKQLAQ